MTAPLTPGFGDGTPYPVIPPGTTTVSVSGQSALDNALSAATAGQKIVLAAGSYTDLTVPSGKSGTASAGISIEAAAGATCTFSGRLSIDDSAYLTVKGLTFNSDPSGELAQARGNSHHIKFHRCTFGPATHPGSAVTGENGNYLFIGDTCKNIIVSYCEFRNKARGGNGFRVYGNFDTNQVCQYILVDHCDFHDFYPALVNDFEPIRLGVSSMSQTDMYAHVIRCVFTSCRSEPEVVSMKANRILTYGSTFDKCAGAPVIRHGRFSAIGDCYILDGASTINENGEGSGGPRFYDADNAVIHNLMQNLSGTNYQAALQLDGGESGTSLSRHVAIQRAFVHHNIIAECATSITVKAHYSIAPSTSRVEDNIVAASGTTAIQYMNGATAAGTGTVLRNDWFASATAAGLAKNSQGVYVKAGYGPRVSMLRRNNVGPANDLQELDGLGSGPITGGGGTGGGGFTADLYVSTSGSDSNSGLTSSQPKRTILAALNAASAGQTISVAAGTYDGNVITSKGGSSSGGFITIRSATKWGAKINGSGSTSNQTAVEINHDYIRIQDFEITGTSTVRNGVIVNANSVEFIGNHIHHTCQFLTGGTSWQGGAGIDLWGTTTRSNILLDRNYIHHIGLTTSTQQLVHGIYPAQPGSNSVISNNVIHNCEDYGIQPYPQDQAVSWKIINNTVSKCGRGIRTGNNTVVRNNISYNNTASNFDVRGSGSILSNNLSGGTGTVSISGVTGGVNPLFVDASGDNYQLQSGSPAIDAGTSTDAPPTDHLGAPRPFGSAIDAGAYEFGATVPSPGGGEDPENPTPTPFTVDAGTDASVTPGGTFARTATEAGTGTVATRSWTITGSPTTTADPTVAAERYSWGTALGASDELNYSGTPNLLKWDAANGPGWAGNGTRSPARVTVNGSAMVITGLDGTATTGSVLHTTSQRYGRWEVRCRSSVTGTGGGTGGGTTGSFTGGSGGPQTDRTNVSYTNSAGTSSSGHIYAAGLDWTKTVGVMVYTDGSGEFGLANPSSTYLLGGTNGLINKAKAHNMVLVTPRAPGGGCDDGDGVCWYDKSGSMQIATKIKWCDDFIRTQVLEKYNIDKRRVVLAGYSSGAQWTTEYYGPQYASAWMEDGLLLAISFGGSPKVTANYPTAFKQNVAAVWDVGANDPAYDNYPSYDAESGYGWYSSNGFTTTELHVIAGENHSRDGDFGTIVDREVTQHVAASTTIGTSGTGSNDYRVRLVLWPADGIVPAGGQYFFLEAAQGGQTGSSIELHYPSLNSVDSFETTSVAGLSLTDWHNFAIEWNSTEIIVWIDGVERVRKSGGATSARRALQDTQGPMKLGVQLDATAPSSLRAAQMEVDWARAYPLVPTGTSAGSAGTVGTVVGTAAALSWTVPTTLGIYTLRYAAFAAGGTLLDDDDVDVTVATSAPPGGGGGGGGGGSDLPILEIVPESILSTEAFGTPTFEIPVATVPVVPTWPDLTLFPGPATYPGASPVEGYVDPRAGIASVRTGWTTYPGPGTFPGLFTFPGWGGPREAPPFDVEVFLLDDGGRYLCPLPDVVDFDLSQVENAPGSVSFTYATEGANFDLLRASTDNGMDAQVAIRFAGGTEWEIHAVLYAAESDDVDDEGTWKFSGSWAESLLEEAVLYPEPGVLDGKVSFTNVTPGALITELISRAQMRGGLEIDTSSFSATFDSRGQDWPEDTISSPTFTPGDSMHYLRVLQLLTEAGLCEFEMRGRRLMLYRPGGRGWDRTKGNTVVLQAGRDLVEVSKQLDTRGVVTSLLVLGKDGDWVEVADDTARGRRRRRIEGASSQTSLSGGSLRAYGRAKLATATTVQVERTHKLGFAEESPLPMREFGVGDWLWSDVDGVRRRMRVAQWTVSLNSSGLSGTVSLGNLIPDPTLKLARKLLGLTDGTGTFGGGTPSQTVQGATPAAPRNVVVDSVTSPGPDGKSISTLLVSWDPVVTAVDGVSGVTITGYRLRWRYVVPASTGNPVPIAGEWTYLNELPNAAEVQIDGVEPDVQVEVQVAAFSDVTTTDTPTTPTDPGTGSPGQAVPIPFNTGAGGVPPQTQAAELILARLESSQTIQENWTWPDAPGVVLQYASALLTEAAAAGVDDDSPIVDNEMG